MLCYGVGRYKRCGSKVRPPFNMHQIVVIETAVDIGTLMPRLYILPLWIPALGQVVWEYVTRVHLIIRAHSLAQLSHNGHTLTLRFQSASAAFPRRVTFLENPLTHNVGS